MPLLDFARHYELPVKRQNLRLILWAGDGVHGGTSDVARLRGYDMYLCRGLTKEGLEHNLADLSPDQTICIIDVFNPEEMAEFCRHFDGAFSLINSDYYGNTPTLPIKEYTRLLAKDGIARNIEGINSLRMPVEEMLDSLELVAPALPPELHEKRMWTSLILDLAKRDELSPGAVWTSPDLKHSYYDFVRLSQERFVQWQKRRNPAWPARAETCEEHWDNLPLKVLLANTKSDDIKGLLDVAAFDRFLCSKIPDRFHNGDISFKQKVLKMLSIEVSRNLTVEIGYYEDERRGGSQFGMTLIKKFN